MVDATDVLIDEYLAKDDLTPLGDLFERSAYEPWMRYFVQRLTSRLHIDFHLDLPFAWLDDPRQAGILRTFVANFLLEFADLGLKFSAKARFPEANLRPPEPSNDKISFLYHSKGRAENTWHIKESYLPGYFYVDQGGYSGWSQIDVSRFEKIIAATSASDIADYLAPLKAQIQQEHISKYAQDTDVQPKLPAYDVFFALQMPDDTVSILHDVNMLDVLGEIFSVAERLKLNVLVKRHPLCHSKDIEKALEQAPSGVEIYTGSIHTAFDRSRRVIVGNSGVGFEALLRGKHVATFGASDYEVATERLRTLIDVRKWLEGSESIQSLDAIKVQEFLYYYLKYHVVRYDDPKGIRQRILFTIVEFMNAERSKSLE